jgi:recombination protein RecA
MKLSPEKQKAYDIFKSGMDKKYGAGTIRILGGNEVSSIDRFSTGIPSVDRATGGGLPRGRFVEIYGPESSGKTTLTLHCIAEAQKSGEICAFVDAEHALDINYARTLGVDTDNLIINQPNTAEEALDIVEELASAGLVGMIIVDSVAALVPKVELEGEMSDNNIGVMSRLMSKACRKITGPASRNNVTVVWINQIRMKIGVMFGSPEVTTGGNALKFYASIRMDVRRRDQIKVGEQVVANETEVKIVKNKVAPPYRVANFVIDYGTGVNKTLDLLRVAVEDRIIEKAGAWYSYKGERVGQGEKNSSEFLKSHPEIIAEIVAKLKQPTIETKIEQDTVDIIGV